MLALLGTPRWMRGDTTEEVVRVTRPVALVAYLAAQGGWVTRAAIATLFWPDLDEREARTFARVLVHRARKLRWVGDGLVLSGDRMRLDLPTDVAVFRAACARRDGDAAFAAYVGPFLDGVALGDAPAYDAWLEAERADLAATALAVARASAESAADAATAADAWQRLAALDPLDPEVAARAVAALAAAGRLAQARALAQAHGERVRAELGAEPDPAVARAASDAPEAVRASVVHDGGGPAAAGALAVVGPSGLVGRDAEIAVLEERLAAGARRLAVTGMGGVGKTRLVTVLLARQRGRFRDGARHVHLAEDADEDAVLAGVERAFGWPAASGDRRARLVAALRDREALVALDGLSDPAAAVPLVEAAGGAAPGVRWLVASHAPPPLPDVVRCDLAGLPADPSTAEPEGAVPPAARLVLDALRRAAPGFVAGPADLASAARVGRAVGGLPLALELAGAWAAAVGLPAVAAACERGDPEFEAFASADRAGRRRSVGEAVSGAWRRLRPRQREALSSLTAFAGDVTVEAAQAVADASPAVLVGLTHAALLRRAGGGRLAMHELVRRVAVRERPRAAVARHAHYFLSRLAADAPALVGAGEAAALARASADLDDLSLAWRNACAEVREALSPAVVHAVARLAELTDDAERFRGWFEAAWRAGGDGAERPFAAEVAAAVAVWLAHLRFATGAGGEAGPLLAHADAGGDLRVRALAAWQRAVLASAAGDHAGAVGLLEGVRGDAETLGDADMLAGVLTTTSNAVYYRDADLDATDALLRRAHALHERTGSPRGLAVTSINLGAVATDRGDVADARRWSARAAEHARAIGNRRLEGIALGNLGHLAMVEGDAAAAEAYLDDAIAARRAVGDAAGVAFARTKRATILSQRGAVDAALLDLHEVVAALAAVGHVGSWVQALGSRARLLSKLGRHAEAEADARAGLARVVRDGAVEDALLALATAATVFAGSGRTEAARRAADAVLGHPAANGELRATAHAALSAFGIDAGIEPGIDAGNEAGHDAGVARRDARAGAGTVAAASADLRAEAAALEALLRPGHAPAA